MNNALKSYKARIMIVDIVMLLLGVGFIIWQDDMLATLILVTGVLVAVAGLILVINFLLDKDKTAFDWTIMIIGVIILAGGILLAIFAGAVVNISVFIFAGLLVIYGIIDIFTSIAITRLTGGIWWVPLLLAFIVAAVGGIINAVQTFFGRKKVLAAEPASTDTKDDLTDH